MSKKVVLAGACRTAIGKMGGALSTTPAPKLGSIVIEEALKRAGVPKDAVDGMCNPGRSWSERSSSGIHRCWSSNRDNSSYRKRCLWFRFELCKYGSSDDSDRRC